MRQPLYMRPGAMDAFNFQWHKLLCISHSHLPIPNRIATVLGFQWSVSICFYHFPMRFLYLKGGSMGCRPGSDPSVALGQAMIPGEALHGLHRAASGCTLREVTFLAKHGTNIPICRWNDPVTFRDFVGQESLGESVASAKGSQKKHKFHR